MEKNETIAGNDERIDIVICKEHHCLDIVKDTSLEIGIKDETFEQAVCRQPDGTRIPRDLAGRSVQVAKVTCSSSESLSII